MVRKEMLEGLRKLDVEISESVKDFESTTYSFTIKNLAEDLVCFDVDAKDSFDLYSELSIYARNFNMKEYIEENSKGITNVQGLLDIEKDIIDQLYVLAEAAKNIVDVIYEPIYAATDIKPGDTIIYAVGNNKYEGVADMKPEVNRDSAEQNVRIQITDGPALILDESIYGIKPIITNHIIDSAKDYNPETIEDGTEVLELPVILDRIGKYGVKHLPENQAGAEVMYTNVRFYQDGHAELVAYGETNTGCWKDWSHAVKKDSQEYHSLCDYIEKAVGEPVQETLKRSFPSKETGKNYIENVNFGIDK